MSGITSGVGLLSGLPIQSIIDQTMAIESRPLRQLQARVQTLQAQRSAYGQLSARLLGLKSLADRLSRTDAFHAFSAASSDPSVLTATAGSRAAIGSYQFQVRSLVTSHQMISRGLANPDRQPVGMGTLAFEIGHGRVNPATTLDLLNGGEGVRRGTIEIRDSGGGSARIDLTTAVSVQDVVEAIDGASGVRVSVRIDGDHLVIEDQAGGTGTLSVTDVGGGHAAGDLGIAGQAGPEGTLVGDRIMFLVDATQLAALNDGNGVSVGKTNKDIDITVGSRVFTVGLRGNLETTTYLDVLNSGHGVGQGTFRITNRAGQTAEVTIDSTTATVGDVLEAINAAGIEVRASAVNGQLRITDDSVLPPGQQAAHLKIEDLNGHAAQDLGIAIDTAEQSFLGHEIYRVTTLGDVIRAINYSVDQNDQLNDVVEASIGPGGRGLVLTSGGEEFTVDVAAGAVQSHAAEDLGLIGSSENGRFAARDVQAGLNTVLLRSLNGGSGVSLGQVRLHSADGNAQALIDFTGAATVQDIIDRVNAETANSNIQARINASGDGIIFEDISGASGTMKLKDITGQTIHDLFRLTDPGPGVVTTTAGTLDTGNTQLQYVSLSTRLEELNDGRGISLGSFQVTARNGRSFVVTVTENQETVFQLLDVINAAAIEGVEARINEQGDGIEIVDTTEGTGRLKVAGREGARTAADLNIAGEGEEVVGEGNLTYQRIDGSYEYRLDIDADDTLNDVRDKINALGIDVSATIIADGTGAKPYRLILNSGVTGTRGQLHINSGRTGLAMETLVRAQDAVVVFGGSGTTSPVVLISSTNALNNVLEDVSINLLGTSEGPVDLTITEDVNGIISNLQAFVSSYNAVLDQIDNLTSFDAETGARGTLFGDNTVDIVRSRLVQTAGSRVPGLPAGFDRLTLVGVHVGRGGRLTFDESEFRAAYAADPEAIETLFADEDNGVGVRLSEALDDLTQSFDGVLARKDATLDRREELFNDRIESLQELLDRKRDRLERMFQGLESSLAVLQGQQSALGALASLAGLS